MVYRRIIQREAALEYRSIVSYMCNILKSKQAAQNFIDTFNQQLNRISDNPELFAVSQLPELAACEYRSFFVNNYIVLYKITTDSIVIKHIFHQSQDYARLI